MSAAILSQPGLLRALACAAQRNKQILCKDRILVLGGDFLWRGALSFSVHKEVLYWQVTP